MDYCEERPSYGFIPEVVGGQHTPDYQSCFGYNYLSAYSGSHIPDLNNKQTFEGFSKLDPNADSMNRFDQVFSPPLAMPSPPEPHDCELPSEDEVPNVAFQTKYFDSACSGSHIPDLNNKQTFEGFSKLDPNADSINQFDQVFRPPLAMPSPPELHDCELPSEDEVPNVVFQTKYFDLVPLYQNYTQKTVRDEICEVPEQDCLDMEITCLEFKPLSSPRFESLRPKPSPGNHFEDPLLKSPEVMLLPPPFTSKMTSCTLWQDLKEVKNSDLLSVLTLKEISLQETMFELMSSEASYLKSLGVLIHHFYGSIELKKTVSRMDHRMVFCNVCQVFAVGSRFLQDLETRLEESLFISEVGDIVLKHCKDLRQTYTTYLTTSTYQSALVNQLLDQNQNFAYVVKKLENDPVCQRQSLKSFLVLPFQRITRIKLLLETILKLTRPNSDAALNLDKSINGLHEILMACEKKTEKVKQIEELICLEMTLDFNNIKSTPLVISTRFLIHQGPLKLLNSKGTYSQRISYNKIYLHLFNDLLIISKKHQKFMVVDHTLFPEHVTVADVKPGLLGLSPDSFLLHLSQSQRGQKTAMILVALSKSDKETWMKALSSK